MSRADRHKRSLSCLILAIENMLQFQENNSCEMRDQWFNWALDTIQDKLRTHDIVDRYPDGRIGVILPETDVEKAKFVKDKIHFALEELPFSGNGSFTRPNLIFGMAEFDEESRDNLMLERAVQSLRGAFGSQPGED